METQSGTQPGTQSGQAVSQPGTQPATHSATPGTGGTSGTRNRGFASMNAEKQREIARKGGKAAHQKGTAHEFTADEARAAGRKGGQQVSANREHMSRIGRIGGKSSASTRRQTGRDAGSGDRNPDAGGSMSHPGDGGGHHAEAVRGTDSGEMSGEAMNAGGRFNDMERADDAGSSDRSSVEQPTGAGTEDVPSPS